MNRPVEIGLSTQIHSHSLGRLQFMPSFIARVGEYTRYKFGEGLSFFYDRLI